MKVHLPGLLDRYTLGEREHEVEASNLTEVFEALEDLFPGIRFRILDERDEVRPHMKVFLDGSSVRDLKYPVGKDSVIYILGALSGG